MVEHPVRCQQLQRLVEMLTLLIDLLARDGGCPWRSHFEEARAVACSLLASPSMDQDALTDLATSITSLFDPKDAGFNDYSPRGLEHDAFDRMRRQVYDAAFELRVVGRY